MNLVKYWAKGRLMEIHWLTARQMPMEIRMHWYWQMDSPRQKEKQMPMEKYSHFPMQMERVMHSEKQMPKEKLICWHSQKD